jgi:hypothetical protein
VGISGVPPPEAKTGKELAMWREFFSQQACLVRLHECGGKDHPFDQLALFSMRLLTLQKRRNYTEENGL